MIIFEHRLT